MGYEKGTGLTYSTPKTSTNEYGTPPQLIRRLEGALGEKFDLDPCSGAERDPIAKEKYTKDDDGLSKPWFGNVFVNPPFSDCEMWAKKSYDEQQNGGAERVVLLLPVRLATGYFHDYLSAADALCFPRGRINYCNSEGVVNGVPFASYIVVFGDPSPFLRLFDELGTVFTPNDIYERAEQQTLS